MKRRFSKILGVGLVVALLASFLVMAAPVSAVTTPVVTLTEKDSLNPAGVISKENTYSILFTTGAKVEDATADEIVVVFEPGTDITGMLKTDIEINSTAGLGGSVYTNATPDTVVVTGTYPAAQTLTITPGNSQDIGVGAIVQLIIGDTGAAHWVTNPDTAGTYNLTVGTQTGATPPVVIEAAVTSAGYTIKVPTIPGLPGVASVYNPIGILMAQDNDLVAAVAAAGVDYTIYVGPGTYDLETAILTIAHEGLTFVSTAGAATTIIDGSGVAGAAISINASDVTFDGFTVAMDEASADGIVVWYGTEGVTVQNNTITEAGWSGIALTYDSTTDVVTDATVTGNLIEDCVNGIDVGGCLKDSTISNNTITGCASYADGGRGINFAGGKVDPNPTEGNTITGNTIIDNLSMGICLKENTSATGTVVFDDNVIEGNTISGNAEGGIEIKTGVTITNLKITGNDITDNEGDGILIAVWDPANTIKFNTITGNDATIADYGIQNDDTDTPVDATFNWWGTTVAADIALMVKAASVANGPVTTSPFLAGTADTVFSATATSLDAKDTVGVRVSVADVTDYTIAVAKYIANPQAALADAIAFFDVYVAGTLGTDATATIKFYAGDANTEVYIWSADTETWGKVKDEDVDFSAYGGYVYLTVDPAMLAGTPFALVAGAAAAIDAPTISSPVVGDDTVRLRPVFAWKAVPDADGYYFQLADNAEFVVPLVKMEGDMGRLSGTTYAYVGEALPYSTAYYWRVKAVSGTVAAGDLAESAWSTGVFITLDEPEEEPAEVWMCSEGLTFDTREALKAHLATAAAHQPVEPPELVIPAATALTPAWIYVIIAVGAVLVIGLIVLIVRTRRVA